MNQLRGMDRMSGRAQPAFQSEYIDDRDDLESAIDLRSIVGLLRRRLRLILGTALLIVAAAGAAILALPPVYSSTTLVMVDPSRKDLLDPSLQASGSVSDSPRIDSEVELIKSDATLVNVIADLNLIGDSEFGVSIGLKDRLLAFLRIAEPKLPTGNEAVRSVIENLSSNLSVQRKGMTYIIGIQARSLDPEKSAVVADAVADAYIRQQLQSKIKATVASRDVIRDQIEGASTSVAQSEEALDSFIESNVEALSREAGRTDLAALQAQINQFGTLEADYSRRLQLSDQSLSTRDWTKLSSELGTQAVLELEAQRNQLMRSLAGAVDTSQQAIDLRAELQSTEGDLAKVAEGEMLNLRQQVANARNQSSALRQQLRESVLSSQLPATILTRIYSLQQNAEIARSQYQTLLARLSDLDTQSSLQIADSRVVSEALAPTEPTFPNPRLILSVAAVVGLGLGIAGAFLVENYVGGFTSEAQLQSVLRTRTVPAVPRQRRPGGRESAIPGLISHSPLSIFSEAIRRIRAGIDQAVRRGSQGSLLTQGTVIMVTSAAPNEGKTTIALSLARAYALSGKSTLLIDCDLRKPGIHRLLELDPSNGLLDYLSGGASTLPLQDITTADPESGAQIILGTRRSELATDQLITGETFTRLIEAAKKKFDVVILDTPPVGPVVDGIYLAQLAGVIAFVVRWASTSQRDAREAVAALFDGKRPEVEIVAVLNQQDITRSAYRSRYAGYYNEE